MAARLAAQTIEGSPSRTTVSNTFPDRGIASVTVRPPVPEAGRMPEHAVVEVIERHLGHLLRPNRQPVEPQPRVPARRCASQPADRPRLAEPFRPGMIGQVDAPRPQLPEQGDPPV